MRHIAMLIFVLLLAPAGLARAEPQWGMELDLTGTVPTVVITVRYGGCAKVNSVWRDSGSAASIALFQASGTAILETADMEVDCACEPIGTVIGTGSKHCPEQQCAADQQCVCSKRCVPVEEDCIPAGAISWYAEDADGNQLVSYSQTLAAPTGNCPMQVEEEDDSSEGGGCSARGAPGAAHGLFLVLLLLVLGLCGRKAPAVWLAVAILVLAPACSSKKAKPEDKEKGRADVVHLEPMEVEIEGSPYEPVIEAQTELLEFFETAGDPADTVRQLRRWRKGELDLFEERCKEALAFYAAAPEKRLGYVSRAGQVWAVVKKRVNTITRKWTPGQQREVGILLNQFSCR
jgi:hypothetical protein